MVDPVRLPILIAVDADDVCMLAPFCRSMVAPLKVKFAPLDTVSATPAFIVIMLPVNSVVPAIPGLND